MHGRGLARLHAPPLHSANKHSVKKLPPGLGFQTGPRCWHARAAPTTSAPPHLPRPNPHLRNRNSRVFPLFRQSTVHPRACAATASSTASLCVVMGAGARTGEPHAAQPRAMEPAEGCMCRSCNLRRLPDKPRFPNRNARCRNPFSIRFVLSLSTTEARTTVACTVHGMQRCLPAC